MDKQENNIFNIDIDILKNVDKLPIKPQLSNTSLLSEDQQKAYEEINNWCYRSYKSKSNENLFALTGSAGTGKTTLLDTFLKNLKSPFSKWRVCVCAPTHKAKKVIGEKTKWKNLETLQSLIGIKPDLNIEDFNPMDPQFNPIGDRKIRDYDLVVIDESSMINTDLYTLLCDCAISAGTLILFVGDTKQLNPVKEYNISPALVTPTNRYNLTQIMRQSKTNPLVILLDALRYDIENDTSTYLEYLKESKYSNEEGEGYEVVQAIDFASALKEVYNSEKFKEDKNFCRYIAWTNQSIQDTNYYIRNKIFNFNSPTGELDEILLSYKTVVDGDDIVLTNSDDYIIEKISDSIISEYSYPLRTKFVHLRGIDTGTISKIHLLIKGVENYTNYAYILKDKLDTAKRIGGRKGWGKFYEFKNKVLLLENIFEGDIILAKKDIDYGYGVTIHKSQGSTYNTVFVNGKDINKNPNSLERKRLWYVALSRASNKVYINL